MPRFWEICVCNIYAINGKDEVDNTPDLHNTLHQNIEFTLEMEQKGTILSSIVVEETKDIRPGDQQQTESYQTSHTQYFKIVHQHKVAFFNNIILRMLSLLVSSGRMKRK